MENNKEIQKLETMEARLKVFNELYSEDKPSLTSFEWAMENIMGFTKEEINNFKKKNPS